MSKSIAVAPRPKKPNQHEQNIPKTGARLLIKNLDFNVKADDLEDLFSSFGTISKYVQYYQK